mmetsp:Transcript_49049/g.118190  ORF Transcript_49049/g.118190 Transcript_49049/m.118190 type:complete len:231 (+) Transcript_49049:161-853(+)
MRRCSHVTVHDLVALDLLGGGGDADVVGDLLEDGALAHRDLGVLEVVGVRGGLHVRHEDLGIVDAGDDRLRDALVARRAAADAGLAAEQVGGGGPHLLAEAAGEVEAAELGRLGVDDGRAAAGARDADAAHARAEGRLVQVGGGDVVDDALLGRAADARLARPVDLQLRVVHDRVRPLLAPLANEALRADARGRCERHELGLGVRRRVLQRLDVHGRRVDGLLCHGAEWN